MADENNMVWDEESQSWLTDLGYRVRFGARGARHYTAPPRTAGGTHWDGTATAPQARGGKSLTRLPSSIATNLAGVLSNARASTTAATPEGAQEGKGQEARRVGDKGVRGAEDARREAEVEDEEGEEEGEEEGGEAGGEEGMQLTADDPMVEPNVPLPVGPHGELGTLLMAMLQGALAALQGLQGHGHWHERVLDVNKRPLCKYCGMRTGWVCSCTEKTPLCGPGVQCMKSHQLRRQVPKTKEEKEQYMAERARMAEEAREAHVATAAKKPSRKRSTK